MLRIQAEALTFDDVSLATLYSEILPKDTDLATSLSDSLNLQIKRDGAGMPLPMNLQDPAMLNVPGLVPVIINITPPLLAA